MNLRRTTLAAFAATTALAVGAGLTAATPTALATTSKPGTPATPRTAGTADRATLTTYAQDTWRSMDAMTDASTGLPTDNITGSLDPATRSGFTSPTNIGAYLWSTVVARDIGLVSRGNAHQRMKRTLTTLATLDRHDDSGMFYNWYDPQTGAKLRIWSEDGNTVNPFLSSVDNAWLATALLLVSRADRGLARRADALREDMDFGFYYNAQENAPGGQIRGGFWDEKPPECSVEGNYRHRGPAVFYTCHHYGAFNTEPRMASYLGIAAGQIPEKHYFGTYRTFPDTCDWSWAETKPVGEWRTYLGVRVFEGALPYRGMHVVPTWGGSMFEALMVPLFVPEETWGPRSWGVNHPLFVEGQIEHGLDEAKYGYWGFSPSNNPAGGYREYGVDPIGMEPNGYASDQERTFVDYGYGDCRPAQKEPSKYGQGVVTPHASFLAYRFAPKAALQNLANLREDFGAYGPGGFYDAINVTTGEMSERYLSLDQGMVMAALGNALAGDDMRETFSTGPMEEKVAPLMRMEEFTGITEGGR